MTLDELFVELDSWRTTERIPLECLEDYLNDLVITLEDVKKFTKFSDGSYQRNLMREGPTYHALILCWQNGQRSPIHDHEGSTCGVKVLKGVATETFFDFGPNRLVFPVNTVERQVGEVLGSADDDIHQISNLQATGELVTLHIYSPPLISMNVHSLEHAQVEKFVDPVFIGGEGI